MMIPSHNKNIHTLLKYRQSVLFKVQGCYKPFVGAEPRQIVGDSLMIVNKGVLNGLNLSATDGIKRALPQIHYYYSIP